MNNQDVLIESETSSFTSHLSSFPKRGEGFHRRRKRHLAWEQAELASGGFYARNLTEIALRYPQLTQSELRVAALVKALLPSWKIADILVISEKAVENYRVKIRRKTGCSTSR